MTIQTIKEHLLKNNEFYTEAVNGKIEIDEEDENIVIFAYEVDVEGEEYCDWQVQDEAERVFANCHIVKTIPYDSEGYDGFVKVYTEIYLAIKK